jgi:protein gp37
VRFLSCEPLLEDIGDIDLTGIHWVIVGGESGAQARPFELEWARKIKARCAKYGAAFFFKQLGAAAFENGKPFPIVHRQPNGKRDVGGVCPENFPPDLNVREWFDQHRL